jgi:hypothetical protein
MVIAFVVYRKIQHRKQVAEQIENPPVSIPTVIKKPQVEVVEPAQVSRSSWKTVNSVADWSNGVRIPQWQVT